MSSTSPSLSSRAIQECLQDTQQIGEDPDALSNSRSWLQTLDPSGLSAIAEVTFFNSKSTDRHSNQGIVSYMVQSILTDADLFASGVRFYDFLHQIDLKTQREKRPEENGPTSIDERAAADLYQYALESAQGHPYRALKILALLGHDNYEHNLRAATHYRHCRFDLLEDIGDPAPESNLYLNGAIAEVQYAPEIVARGVAIARDCQAKTLHNPFLWKLCNDLYVDYQADYYHVTTAAFLNCRRTIAQNIFRKDSLFAGASKALENTADRTYLSQVRKYKIARFREEINFQPETDSEKILASWPSIQAVLLKQLKRIEKGQSVLLTGTPQEWGISPADFEAIQSILRRYEFEISFRIYQHQLGMEFGKRVCKDISNFRQLEN